MSRSYNTGSWSALRSAIRAVGGIIALVIVAAIVALCAMRAGVFTPSTEDVEARFGAAPSEFVGVDGVTLHVRDEGRGPAVVLLHGSYTSLHLWDPWAAALVRDGFRVIRLDWPPYGLSSDPSGIFDNRRAERLLADFVDQRGVQRFILAGTSTGSILAILYAVDHPQRVRALALSTLPLILPSGTHYVRPEVQALQWIHRTLMPDYFPRFYYRLFLEDLVPHRERITAELVEQFYDLNNLPGGFARQDLYIKANARMFEEDPPSRTAARVTAPVLIQWGDANSVMRPAEGDRSAAFFTAAPVSMIHYAGVGHYPMWEIPEQSLADFERFASALTDVAN